VSGFATLKLDVVAPIGRITLARPERLNALSPELLAELISAAHVLAEATEVKVVVVRGEGRAFSAGFDIDAVDSFPARDRVDLGRRMAEAVSGVPALTIAAIHGHCVGGGLVLASACDIRIASENARFVIPEVDLGIPLAWGGIPRLVRELGPAVTKELVLTCRPFTAAEAHQLRFLNRVVPDGDLDAEVDVLAASLASKPGFLIRHTKQLVDALVEDAYSTRQSFRDAEIMLAALQDAESSAARQRYLEARGRRRGRPRAP
jgi:enoyl-CoA hydratase/carnithine racemase